MKSASFILLFFSILIFSSCRMAGRESVLSTSPLTAEVLISTAEVALTDTPLAPTSSPTRQFSPTPLNTGEPPAIIVCPPLDGFSAAELENAIVNPYSPPPAGFDRPHQGLDLGVLDGSTGLAVPGEAVHAILSGEVRMAIENRFPYGNALLVESAFDLERLDILEPIPTTWVEVTPDPALTCPVYEERELSWDKRSIYILYAHLDHPPEESVGKNIQCGDVIGEIGMSGNALNPHIHIEARIGPAGAIFDSMAHYDSSATKEEMQVYCTWRVSGIFQHFDPMILLRSLPADP